MEQMKNKSEHNSKDAYLKSLNEKVSAARSEWLVYPIAFTVVRECKLVADREAQRGRKKGRADFMVFQPTEADTVREMLAELNNVFVLAVASKAEDYEGTGFWTFEFTW
jgi:hypothetical protein